MTGVARLGLLALGLTGCGTGQRLQPSSRLDAEYLNGTFTRPPPAGAATSLYRDVVARSLGSRCKMFPTDSQAFDRRAESCGATAAALLGVARLYLEVAAQPALLPSLLADGRVRWVDVPSSRACGP